MGPIYKVDPMTFATALFAFAGPLAPLGFLSNAAAVGWKRSGVPVPRIPEKMLESVAFMFRNTGEADRRERMGGSGVVVGRLLPGSEELFGSPKYLPYLVSNRHVVLEGSACVASINRNDGGRPEVWDIDQNDWHAHPGGDDLAATCVRTFMDRTIQKVSFIRDTDFLTQQRLADLHVGIGDDAFMIGRFINHQGHAVNEPALRFGNISVMPSGLWTKDASGVPRLQTGYAVEMRSRTGFSGSPVCVFRNPGTSLRDIPAEAELFWAFLGLNWGYVPDETGENTWLNGVSPAWKILELLDTPPLRERFDYETELIRNFPRPWVGA